LVPSFSVCVLHSLLSAFLRVRASVVPIRGGGSLLALFSSSNPLETREGNVSSLSHIGDCCFFHRRSGFSFW
ncbi:unnamed protein product, partial [Linum tenue]